MTSLIQKQFAMKKVDDCIDLTKFLSRKIWRFHRCFIQKRKKPDNFIDFKTIFEERNWVLLLIFSISRFLINNFTKARGPLQFNKIIEKLGVSIYFLRKASSRH